MNLCESVVKLFFMFFRILQIAIPFIWFGAVAAISFMEAPLKFTAPNITLPLGLEIGYVIFHALNKVEIVLGVLFLVSIIFAKPDKKSITDLFRHCRNYFDFANRLAFSTT